MTTVRVVRPWTVIAASCALLFACGDDDGMPADAAAGDDASTADGAAADAMGLCGAGEIESQGSWEDWDSGNPSFMGIFDATIAEGQESAQTAPNGRAILCLAAGVDHELSFSQADYMPMTASIVAANLASTYSVRGLTPARATDLFTNELTLTVDAAAAHVLVELPAGATAAIDANNDGQFQVPSTSYAFFANVEIGAGTATLTITPPGGQNCTAATSLPLAAGVIAFTSVVCM